MAAIGSALRVARSSMAKGERQVVSGHSSPGDRELAHNEAASPDGDFANPASRNEGVVQGRASASLDGRLGTRCQWACAGDRSAVRESRTSDNMGGGEFYPSPAVDVDRLFVGGLHGLYALRK